MMRVSSATFWETFAARYLRMSAWVSWACEREAEGQLRARGPQSISTNLLGGGNLAGPNGPDAAIRREISVGGVNPTREARTARRR